MPQTWITRANVDALLDAGKIEVATTNGNWWRIRRNGATKTWKKYPARIRIPFKMGLYGHGAIEESDFIGGALNPAHFRVAD
jgi:hypothetical protein